MTGFGLLGHAYEMMAASGTAASISMSRIPLLSQARRLVAEGVAPGGSRNNAKNMRTRAEVGDGVSEEDFLLVCDAQTSGGLLVALPEAEAEAYAARCRALGALRGRRGRTSRGRGRRAVARRKVGRAGAVGMADSEEWVEVAAVGDDEEAEIIAGLLESEDIPCEIEGAPSPWPENLGALGASRVLVPPDRADEARALIAERERDAEKNLTDPAGE